ncbi:PucR family transcriptional regulator [Tsukamurella conjunctivitidis]|uniref:PucR family transcriptional regulator n=3 Tax=Tsukamurella TaxID=2060 RepID=A0A5C5S1S2_9ACTN|nr:PucR family transcriptional regulator [Tsukamurella columbiensis]TWS28660.1 PucR family transcriptional regulator [Tsukamurella conjunctivitidis]
MEELWPAPPPDVADAIRSVCQRLLADADAFADAITRASLPAQYASTLLPDASLVEEDRELNRSDLAQWVTSNIQRPGRRVDVYIGPRTRAFIHDLVARGIAPDFTDGWRSALTIGWRRWLQECMEFAGTPELLVEVLDVSAKSMIQYALDSVTALREASLAAAMGNADADAIALVQLLATGAPISADLAESRLRYRLERQHVGLAVWVDDLEHAEAMDEVVAALRTAATPNNALTVRASATSRWIWLSGENTPDQHHLEKILLKTEHVRAAIGRPGDGLAGFRTSHQDALAAQSLIVRLGSPHRFTRYADVELVDSLTKDRESARRFVITTLGPLADADPALRQSLLTYVQCGFSATRAAANLYAHRNTVERRVSRANEVSSTRVEDNPTHVAAALMVLDIAPDITRDASPPAV